MSFLKKKVIEENFDFYEFIEDILIFTCQLSFERNIICYEKFQKLFWVLVFSFMGLVSVYPRKRTIKS